MVKSEKTLPLSPLRPNKKSLKKKEKKAAKDKKPKVVAAAEVKGEKEAEQQKENREKQEVDEQEAVKEKPPPKPVVSLQKPQIEEGLKAFKSLLDAKKKGDKAELFGDGPARIFLQVAGIKLPADADKCIVKVRLPHTALASDADTLLVVKDQEKGIKADHEPTLLHYTSLLEEKQVTAIAEVMPMRQLRVEYKEFEAKRQLCNRFERVLVDDRVIRLVPQFLGKPFYKKRKLPVAVDLTKTDLKKEISRCIATEQMPLSNHGTCASLAVGVTSLGNSELLENIEVAVKALEAGYPGGWKNVRSVHLFCSNTSLPIYLTDRTGVEVGKVETKNAARRRDRIIVDELSTIPGATVTVNRAGGVKLKRDPEETWQDDVLYEQQEAKRLKKNPEAAEDAEETTEIPTEAEKKNEEPKKKKKKGKDKKTAATEDSDSDDDDMQDMEMEYMRKVAEEEEEIERKETENMEKLGDAAAAANSDDEEDALEDEEDESEVDDDIEVENLLSDQEEGDEPDQQLIMNRNADSDGAPEEPVVEEEKKKFKKKKKKDQKKVGPAEAKKKSGKKNADQPSESKKAKKQKKPKKEEKKVKSDLKKSKKKK